MLKLLMFISILCLSLIGYSQTDKGRIKGGMSGKDTLFAVFNWKSADGYSWARIELKFNKKFNYSSGTDLQQSFSYGFWEFRKDTLFLKSDLERSNIPLLFRESRAEKRDSLYVGWVKNLNGDVVKDAALFYNDSITNCMPVFDECRFYKGTIKRLKAVFSNNLSTQWYEMNDTSATYIEPVLNLSFSLDKYVFFANKRFLLSKKGLYELDEVKRRHKGKVSTFFVKNTSFFYKRLK
jgi:hypothetical protein